MSSNVSLFNYRHQYHKINTMWCSALVAFVYKKCGLLSHDIPWSIINPCDFSTNSQRIKFYNCTLDDEELKSKISSHQFEC